MRIVYTHDIFSRQSVGGISRYYVELIRHLSEELAEVDVLAGSHTNRHLRDLDGHIKLRGRYQPKSIQISSYQRLVNRYLQKKYAGSTAHTLVHHTYYSFTKPLSPARLVATVHDLIPERFPKQFGWKARVLSAAKRRTCDLAERILTISHTTKNDLIDLYGISPDRIDVTYLGNSLFRFVDAPEPPPHAAPYILYVGSRGGYKNCRLLWEAYSYSGRLKRDFEVVCFGGGSFSSEEQNLLDQLNIANRVVQKAGGDGDLANYYRHASAFIYPSLYEGFGIPPVEAMSFGCPIIASWGGSIPEVMGPAAAYIDPYDADMLLATLKYVLYDESLRNQLQIQMKARESRFRWEKTARQTLACYEKAAA